MGGTGLRTCRAKSSEGQHGAAWSEQRRRANRTAANRKQRRASSGEEQLALAFGGNDAGSGAGTGWRKCRAKSSEG
jgi:hypothetical protein